MGQRGMLSGPSSGPQLCRKVTLKSQWLEILKLKRVCAFSHCNTRLGLARHRRGQREWALVQCSGVSGASLGDQPQRIGLWAGRGQRGLSGAQHRGETGHQVPPLLPSEHCVGQSRCTWVFTKATWRDEEKPLAWAQPRFYEAP